MPLARHVGVIVRRHPANLEKAVGFIFADGVAALPGLGRKLPHYGKYSYLGFEGDEPVNVLKGQWTPTDSPLRVDLRPASERRAALAALALPPRAALAELPPVFSQKALLAHVAWLSAPEREGRGVGSKGLESRGRVRRSAVQGDRPAAGRRRRLLLPVVHGDTLALRSARAIAQRDRRAARLEARVGGPVGAAHGPLRPPRPRLAGRAQGRRGEAPSGRRRQREWRRGPARAREGDRFGREAAAHARLRRVRRRGGGPPGLAPLRRASALPAREDDRCDQPRHGRAPVRPEALGARDGQRLRVAAHLPRRRLRHRRRGPDDPGGARVLRPEELHRQGRARGAGLHRPARRLPPARRHRGQDRRRRAREGGDLS